MKNFKINCLCGAKPQILKRPISAGSKVKYYFVKCSKNCEHEIQTFATRKPEFCSELWHATVLKVKEIKKL